MKTSSILKECVDVLGTGKIMGNNLLNGVGLLSLYVIQPSGSNELKALKSTSK